MKITLKKIIKYLFEIKPSNHLYIFSDNEINLNIGCGKDKFKGYINIDKFEAVNPDLCINIEQGLPFKDESVSNIYSSHCLEHIKPDKWNFVLNEIMRVAKNGCIIILSLPFDNINTRTHIDHYRTFGFDSFKQYEEGDIREYYANWRLKRLHKEYTLIQRWFYTLFPETTGNINYKFIVIKKQEVNDVK